MDELKLLEYKVLFVEDDLVVREKVSSRLRRYFKDVYEASDGLEGLELYKVHKPQILFLDINLPKLSGLDLLKIIRENDQNTKAVMLTAHSDVEYLLKANELKLTKYIIKPLNREILTQTITHLIHEMQNFKVISLKNLILKEGYVWSYENKMLQKDGADVSLSPNEKKVFEFLADNPNRSLNFDDIILYVWDSFDLDHKETLKTTIKNMRKKLPQETIVNIYGEGFKLLV